MMKRTISYFLSLTFVFAATIAISSCSGKKFNIKGNITEAKDSMLYLENISLDGPIAIDSAKLDENGSFSFVGDAPDAPEFYRLRIAGQIINISIDSTETVSVNASYPTMAVKYNIEGSENCSKIKELSIMQIDLQNRIMSILNNQELKDEVAEDSIARLMNNYKNNVKMNYIYKQPMKAYSYFALFQAIGNRLIFNPRESRDDIKAFAAVATSWDVYYPDAVRGKNLHNIAIEGMRNIRIVENQNREIELEAGSVSETGIIDIPLYDNKGRLRHITDLKGKVVLLDFHVFSQEGSTERIMRMRDLYNKYHRLGFEIYQVSLDADGHFWKMQTEALPWINVRDEESLKSRYMATFNIRQLPAFFIIDKTNSIVKRDSQIQNLEAEIKKLL